MGELDTLAFRLPRGKLDELLGTITAYPLTTAFATAWDELPPNRRGGRPVRSRLATALCATTGQFTGLFAENDLSHDEQAVGEHMLLVTDTPFGDMLPEAVYTWEEHHRGGRGTPSLHTMLPEPDPTRLLSRSIDYRRGEAPRAPGWVFRIAGWQIMRHLATTRLRIDGHRDMPLQIDTAGNLLAWDEPDLICNPAHTAYAMARIDLRLATKRGFDDLIVSFDAHLTRIGNRWNNTRNLWINRNDRPGPILRLPVYHWKSGETEAGDPIFAHRLDEAVPKIVERCDLAPLPSLPADLPAVPGAIRPQVAKHFRHPLGTGLGPRFMLRLREHIEHHLPDLEPLQYQRDRSVNFVKPLAKPLKTGLPASATDASGFRRVLLLCLYSTTEAHDRMVAELQTLTSQPLALHEPDRRVSINDRLDILLRHCPDLLSHGYVNRAAMIESLPSTSDDELVAAWIETSHHPSVPVVSDAKPHLRRLLGSQRVPTQFLATEPRDLPKGAHRRTDKALNESATASLRDLLQSAGVTDHRVPTAAARPDLKHRLDRPALLVGIHARRQQTSDDDHAPPLILSMVATRATPDPDASWPSIMYRDHDQTWQPIGTALAAFHAGSLGDRTLGRHGDKAARTRDYVEQALAELSSTNANTSLPIVIFVDAQATRTIWPGLQNSVKSTELPGDSLRNQGRDVAVVRCNDDDADIGRPVNVHDNTKPPEDPLQPAAPRPGRKLYSLADTACPTWMLAGTSRTFQSKGGDTGAEHTRWSIRHTYPPELAKNWHAFSGIEIAVIAPGGWQPATLAALTARLCDQAASWDGRTLRPQPLHAATKADLDHPEYRSKDQAEQLQADDEAVNPPPDPLETDGGNDINDAA